MTGFTSFIAATVAAFSLVAFGAPVVAASDFGVPTPIGQPLAGGHLVFARAFDPVSFHPLKTSGDNGSFWDMVQIYDQLVENQVGRPEPGPGLAASWSVSDDGLTYTFKLRSAKFSNGQPVTANDVKYSIDRFRSATDNPSLAFLAASIDSTSTPGPDTFVIHLSHVDGGILPAMAIPAASIVPQSIVQSEGDDAFGAAPVGSGPFKLARWVRGQYVDLERNPYYWDAPKPYLDTIRISYVPDANTRMLQLQSSQTDVAEAIPYSQVDQLATQNDIRVQVENTWNYDAIWLNHKFTPLANALVRQALNYAIDKTAIIHGVYGGHAEVANSTLPKVQYWNEQIAPYKFDVKKAKDLMSQAGYEDGFELELDIPAGDPTHKTLAVVLQSQWAAIGVRTSINEVESASLYDQYTKGNFQAAIPFPVVTSDVSVPDELAIAFLQYSDSYKSFFTSYNSAEINSLVTKLNQSASNEDRQKIWSEIQEKSLGDAPWVPIAFPPATTGIAKKVQNFRTLAAGWWDLKSVWLLK